LAVVFFLTFILMAWSKYRRAIDTHISYLKLYMDQLQTLLRADYYSTISSSAEDHGTISPIGVMCVRRGANQIFTVNADSGFNIKEVTIDGTPQSLPSPPVLHHNVTVQTTGPRHAIRAKFKSV
jgi:hypothetical protein